MPSPRRRVLTICALVFFGVFTPHPATADISLCASLRVPRGDAEALERATFAFDGVVVDGRRVPGSPRTSVLVSPFTFRVLRWLKGGSFYGFPTRNGELVRRVWDAAYATHPETLLEEYHPTIQTRIRGEIVATRGETWRVFAMSADGINFTCTQWLGSHRLASNASRPGTTTRGVALSLAALAAALLVAALWALRSGERADKRTKRPTAAPAPPGPTHPDA